MPPIQTTEHPLRIVTEFRFEDDEIRLLRDAVPDRAVEVRICATHEEFQRELAQAEIVYGQMTGADLERAPNLKWVQLGSAGIENLDPRLRDSPVQLTNYAGTFAPGIGETTFGLLLSLTRGLARYYIPQFLRHEWKPVGTPKSTDHVEISGRTMGIVGFGGIGRAIAKIAFYGFNMRVIAIDVQPQVRPEYVEELLPPGLLADMVGRSDVVVAAAPLTPQTEGMFNELVFRQMKRGAWFLAVSRGKLFDDMALVKALKEGWIAGAGLDVFPEEPPPSNHPIFDCPNVVMSMHTSGYGPDRQRRLVGLFAENLKRYATGGDLLNVVNRTLGF